MRLILYLGKGGVGKTTTAAATAARAAELGHRTLVVSTDVAHSLADALDVPLESQPTPVAPNLWGQEINVLDEVRRHWGQLQTYLQNVLRRKGMNEVAAEELSVIPGMEEVVSLMHIRRQAREGNFDAVIVDAAPTGETVRLLTMPETFQWYAGRVLNWTREWSSWRGHWYAPSYPPATYSIRYRSSWPRSRIYGPRSPIPTSPRTDWC